MVVYIPQNEKEKKKKNQSARIKQCKNLDRTFSVQVLKKLDNSQVSLRKNKYAKESHKGFI